MQKEAKSYLTAVNLKRKNEIVPWDEGIQSMFDEIRKTFSEPFMPILPYGRSNPFSLSWGERAFGKFPSVDLADRGKEFVVTADLPGYTKEEVDLKVTEHWLQIRAESKKSREEENRKKNYILNERYYSSFSRMIPFPDNVTPSGARATMKNGVLEIIVPKSTARRVAKAERVPIS